MSNKSIRMLVSVSLNVLIIVLGLSVACIVLNSLDKAEFIFDPEIKILSFSPIFLILYTLYMFFLL